MARPPASVPTRCGFGFLVPSLRMFALTLISLCGASCTCCHRFPQTPWFKNHGCAKLQLGGHTPKIKTPLGRARFPACLGSWTLPASPGLQPLPLVSPASCLRQSYPGAGLNHGGRAMHRPRRQGHRARHEAIGPPGVGHGAGQQDPVPTLPSSTEYM